MTVAKNIEYGLKLKKISSSEIKKRLAEVIALTQLEKLENRLPSQLSGGQQQRVALARALAIQPKVLLFDEPLSHLDANLRIEMRERITAIHNATKITTVYVTHDQKEALSMGTHISVMMAAQVLQTDTPKNIYKYPKNSAVAGFIGGSNILSARYVAEENGFHKVQTPLGEFKSTTAPRSDAKFKKDQKVLLSIRSETVSIATANKLQETQAADDGATNKFECVLDRDTYLGDLEQLELKSKTDFLFSATLFNSNNLNPEFKIGDRVICSVNAANTLILAN
jgi:ABC-type Fe3+/spermidine/putrescine transport system ATPase subunit